MSYSWDCPRCGNDPEDCWCEGPYLDPEPWVSVAPDFERYASENDYEGRHSVVFQPRDEYEQNEKEYT